LLPFAFSLHSCRADDSDGAFEGIVDRPPDSIITGYNGPSIVRLRLRNGNYHLMLYLPITKVRKGPDGRQRNVRTDWFELSGPYTITKGEIKLVVTNEQFKINYPTISVWRDGKNRVNLRLGRVVKGTKQPDDVVPLDRVGNW